jgi:hypothetical protein
MKYAAIRFHMRKVENPERPARANRRLNGMADTAGIRRAPQEQQPITRDAAILDAALRAWEARRAVGRRAE